MNTKINELTKEQEKLIPLYREKFREIGLSTKPGDKEKSKEAIFNCYEFLGKKRPTHFLWFDSPIAAILASCFLSANLKGIKLKGQLRGQLRDQLSDQLSDQLRDQLSDQLRDQLSDQLWDQLRDQLGDQLKEFRVWSGSFGSFDAYWASLYAFINDVLPVKKSKGVNILKDIIENTGYYLTYENLVIASDKPTKITFDDNKRLHNQYGPAIEYKDGYAIYALHGIRMTDSEWFFDNEIKEKDKINKIIACKNTEQRVVMMKYIGYDKFLSQLGASCIHEDKNTKDKLYTLNIEGITTGPYLMMTCPSTGKVYFEGVGDADKYQDLDPTIKTTTDAHVWRYKYASNNLLKNINGFDIKSLEYNT